MPLAEHDVLVLNQCLRNTVSIHVPLAEHDLPLHRPHDGRTQFQFTCPSRSTTGNVNLHSTSLQVSIHVPLAEHDAFLTMLYNSVEVSIHVPLAEHDVKGKETEYLLSSFNSRAPRGARLEHCGENRIPDEFQFTCPSRSTTSDDHSKTTASHVSIHVPLAEHDRFRHNSSSSQEVSIHVPLAEHDL